METSGGMVSRITERVLTVVAIALLAGIAVAIWRMAPETRTAIWNGIWRTIAWVLIAVTLPWTARLFIRRIMAAGTNWAGVGLVAGLCAGNLLAAALLMTGWPSGFWSWAAGLAALVAAGTYNYLVAEYLAETVGA